MPRIDAKALAAQVAEETDEREARREREIEERIRHKPSNHPGNNVPAAPIPIQQKEKVVQLNVGIPESVDRSLNKAWRESGLGKKGFILKALRDAGVEVDKTHLKDRRYKTYD